MKRPRDAYRKEFFDREYTAREAYGRLWQVARRYRARIYLGIFCGILIFICVEIYKTRGTVLGILICIPTFILCGFEHSVADIFYFVNARIFSWQAVGVVLAVALGNALGALLIPAARRLYAPAPKTA